VVEPAPDPDGVELDIEPVAPVPVPLAPALVDPEAPVDPGAAPAVPELSAPVPVAAAAPLPPAAPEVSVLVVVVAVVSAPVSDFLLQAVRPRLAAARSAPTATKAVREFAGSIELVSLECDVE
jgi:hypothetical protein